MLAGIGGLAIFILVLAMLRDPGMPAHVQEDYMRVAGGLLRPEIPLPEVDSLSVQLRDRFGHSVRVPALAAHRFTLEGGPFPNPEERRPPSPYTTATCATCSCGTLTPAA